VIQTVDSIELGERIARMAEVAGKQQQVMVEVNVGLEPQKAGVDPADVERVVRTLQGLPSLSVIGLMAIPPMGDDAESVRPHFKALRELRDGTGLAHLSMGMTEDFEVAIEEGSTMIRVGRAIFGSRG
jgi:uncharacterized pyridoxal phosphate-containing UPF0001 family protein